MSDVRRKFYRLHSRKTRNSPESTDDKSEIKLSELLPRPEIKPLEIRPLFRPSVEPPHNQENIIKYTEQMMETFEQRPFSAVDALIFSWLSYIDFPDFCIPDEPVRLCDLYKAELFPEMFSSAVAYNETKTLFSAAAASPRYRDIGVSHFVSRLDPESLKQFSAVNFHVSDKLRFIAFRGTDKYIVGWKEDLCLALEDPVESQKSSVRYLTRCAGGFDGEIITGGHSKGGNLAVYSAALCDDSVRDKISAIYSFDGPGIGDDVTEGLIERISDRIIKIVPQSSIIGLLMEKRNQYRIVKSDRHGVSQHMAYYWHITDGDFDYADELSYESRIISTSINTWISSLDYEERSAIINSLFELIGTTNIEALDEIDFIQTVSEIRRNFDEMNPEARKRLIGNIKSIFTESIKNIPKAVLQE